MPTPITSFDQRYSDPAATPVGWEQTEQALAAAELFWVTTVRSDGRPHSTPVVAVWTEGALWFSTGEGEQKFVNLGANPQVLMTTGCSTWDRGLDVIVEGEAVRVTGEDVLERVAIVFGQKWDGRWQYAVRDGCFRDTDGRGKALVFAVTPVKVFAHAKGDPFGATRHEFPPRPHVTS